jgi:beta-glucosidase
MDSAAFTDGSGHKGLKGEYFHNLNFEGKPVLVRVDKKLDFGWGDDDGPLPLLKDSFTVRWTGIIRPVKTCFYKFYLSSDDGSRLFINGEKLIENWGIQGMRTKTCVVALEKGKSYNFRIDYFENTGFAGIKLCWQQIESNDAIKNAVALARKSDVAVIFAGLSDTIESEGWDIPDLKLPPGQDELISAVAAVNPKTIVVINSGIPVDMEKWEGKVSSIIQAWYPGMEGGNAIADLLLGNINPSGKLPATFPKKASDYPAMTDYPEIDGMTKYSEGIFVGYRYFDTYKKEPMFPFGHGLSYTSFKYSKLEIDPKEAVTNGYISANFTITNTGKLAGAEVCQLYVSEDHPSKPRPEKELKGFNKVELNPGESRKISIKVSAASLGFYDSDIKKWVTEPGTYKFRIGSSSRDIRLEGYVKIK